MIEESDPWNIAVMEYKRRKHSSTIDNNGYKDMSEFYCSVCWSTVQVTLVAATAICKKCLAEVAEKNRSNDNTLKEDLKNAITKENDIYD